MTAQAGGPEQPTIVHKRKILGLVVHGVGEQTAGSTLRSVVNGFYPLIRKRIDENAGIDVRPRDDKELPQVRISFRKWAKEEDKGKTDKPHDSFELVVREVHWAQAFVPPSFGGLASGLVLLLTTWLRRVDAAGRTGLARFVWFMRLLGARLLRNVIVVATMIVLLPVFVPVSLLALIGGWTGWAVRPWRWWRWMVSTYAGFQPAVVETAIVVASPLIIAIYIILVLLESLGPLRDLLPGWVGKVRQKIVSIGTSYLGDVWAYAGQPWEASQIRTRFEQRFYLLLDEEDKDPPADAMFVIAHSLGCPVSYEGLSGRRMSETIVEKFGQRRRLLYYFTVGSAIPALWRVVPESEQGRLYRKLPSGVEWHDFFSRYDPVRNDIICGTGEPPHAASTPVEHPVVNQMDLFAEHNAYWNNAEQVLAPILAMITREPSGGDETLKDDLRLIS